MKVHIKQKQWWHYVFLTSIVWFLLVVGILYYVVDCLRGSTPRHYSNIYKEHSPSKIVDHCPKLTQAQVPVVTHTDPQIDNQARLDLESLMKDLRFDSEGPGAMGKPYVTPKSDDELMKEMFKENQFNLLASNRISLNRSLPDVRNVACTKKQYLKYLPQTSVIIVFHNEAWSTLLRTIHTVISRSPSHLLKEIILIDDLSDRWFLKRPLDLYAKTLEVPVIVKHLERRSGLVQARLVGAKVASGETITFLDAHVEVAPGWLEPLMDRIADDRSRVVCPVIDVISDETFEYIIASDDTWGGFDWKLTFRWYKSNSRGTVPGMPVKSPALAGGLFAINREFFFDIGSYDEGFEIWGGENLEMSFRIWQCGGNVEIHPCSHVGHVFRKHTPYTFPGGTDTVIHRNTLRTVEVWMEQYKEFFYKVMPGVRSIGSGDISARLQMKQNLKCHTFRWYLENVYPESSMPTQYYSLGNIRQTGKNLCIDYGNQKEGALLGLTRCSNMSATQAWTHTSIRDLRNFDEQCLDARSGELLLQKCTKTQGDQEFSYDPRTQLLTSMKDGRCLVADLDYVTLEKCNQKAPNHKWELENYSTYLQMGEL